MSLPRYRPIRPCQRGAALLVSLVMLLLLTLMDRQHVSTRDELLRAMSDMSPFAGVTGRFTFAPNGEYQVEPTLLTVEGEAFKQVE